MTLSRTATETVALVDCYCRAYEHLFVDVRSFEHFKLLHFGLIAVSPRKTLPAIARVLGTEDAQALHHFVANSPWDARILRQQRLNLVRQTLRQRPFLLCIDETGDRKKGRTTDYAARQYITNLGRVENGIVSVNACGVLDGAVFPLTFKVFKPEHKLKSSDQYKSKSQLAVQIIEELMGQEFCFEMVLADCLYGESRQFIEALEGWGFKYAVMLRGSQGVWMPQGRNIRLTRWRQFNCVFDADEHQPYYIREALFGRRLTPRFCFVTTDPRLLPVETTRLIMTDLEGDLPGIVGHYYRLRARIVQRFKRMKNGLGWADYRLTEYAAIERWWELVLSACWMVSQQSQAFAESLAFWADGSERSVLTEETPEP
ncbi:IS701 family transposase [Gloeobacter violaceus]|uniref:Glr0172 protein n=1 Tax=Gloeobacter violaceus (strain ATCC 29082 / PCC 7421) TaxID=251221 RepID=Q7NP85_GLOVI|nr:IS701 family transposase [Gloeobacter violaceus]BAC88113.1 glr0172 [Gloeobacter violaceus PCC 7421]